MPTSYAQQVLGAYGAPQQPQTEQPPEQANPQSYAQQVLAGYGAPTGAPAQGQEQGQPFQTAATQQWDWKTAEFGLHGEALPEGAAGWTPYGTPYWKKDTRTWQQIREDQSNYMRDVQAGKIKADPSRTFFNIASLFGIDAKLKEYGWTLTKDVKPASQDEWSAIKQQWQSAQERYQTAEKGTAGVQSAEQRAIGREELGLAGQAIGAWWKGLEASKSSPLSYAAKGIELGIKAIGDVFSVPAIAVERGLSALSYGIAGTIEAAQGPVPRLGEDDFTKGIRENQTGVVRDPLSNAFSDKLDYIGKRIQEGWNAGRVFYAGTFDQTIRDEYIRRYRAGEDPDLLGMELTNRSVNVWGHEINANLIEAGGQLIFDPLNFVGKVSKAGELQRKIERAQDVGGLYRDSQAVEALSTISKTQDTAQQVASWKTVVNAHQRAVQNLEEGKLLKQTWTRDALDVASRQKAQVAITSDWLGLRTGEMIREGYQHEDLIEALKAGIRSLSKDENEAQEALAYLARLPNAKRWAGDDANLTYITLRNLLTDDEGIMNFGRLDKLLSKMDDLGEFATNASRMLEQAAGYQYNTIDQMAEAARSAAEAEKTGLSVSKKTRELAEIYENQVPDYAKVLNAVNDSNAGQIRQAVNNTLGKYYFNYQGGVAAKNILSNNILIGIDAGLKAFAGFEEVVQEGRTLVRPKIWTDGAIANNLHGWFGEFKPAATAGFETLQSAASGGKKAILFGKWMESGERSGAMRIFDSSVRDTMKKLLKLENLGDVSSLRKAGLSENDLNVFEKLFYLEKGDGLRALSAFRSMKAGKAGQETMEAWRTLEFLTKHDMDVLDHYGLLDEFYDLARNAKTPDEIEAAFARWKKTLAEYASDAARDTPGMSADNPALAAFGALSEAENAGHLERGASAIFATITEAADNAMREYSSMLQKTIDNLVDSGRLPPDKAAALRNEEYRLFDPSTGVLERSGQNAKRVSDEMVRNAVYYYKQGGIPKKGTLETWQSLWKQIGLDGVPPADLTRSSLIDALWKQTKERQAAIWNSHFESAFSESEKLKNSLAEYMDTNALESQFSQARWAVQKAQEYRNVVYKNGQLWIQPKESIFWMAMRYGIPTASEKGAPLDRTLLKIINDNLEEGAQAFSRIEDVPAEQALQAFEKWRVEKGRPAVDLSGFAIPPSHADGAMPSFGRGFYENLGGMNAMLDRSKNDILSQWGRRVESPFSPSAEDALQNFARNASGRVDEARTVAVKVGTEARNFTLLNYGQRTYQDLALSWLLPYHFWYSRQYANWIKRLALSPEVIAGYAKYRTAMERIHYDLPDFYKQNVNVSGVLEFLGIKTDHPLFVNLEAAVNPLYGLTGTDFNDPAKRTDWLSNTLDDMGKFGPSVWAPLNIANAIRLSMQGEQDAASRWAGRLFPETKQIKEFLTAWTGRTHANVAGMNIPYELDPAVLAFSGGLDPYERNRVGRALAAMIGHSMPDGTVVTKEMALDAARTQSGPLWEQAQVNAQQLRAGPGGVNTLISWIGGVGFKGRTQEDVELDQMFGDLGRLQAMNAGGGLTPDQYRQAWEKLAETYPFMETALLARRGGAERDSAYTYNVLSRIPPGDSTQLYKDLNIDQDLVSRFYQDKGDMSKWTETDRSRFMAAMIDIGAVYAMPSDATRREWNQVKTDYRQIQEEISRELGFTYTREGGKVTGRGVWDLISTYYDLKDTDKQKAEDFKAAHPEIDQAFALLNEAKISDPLLSKYYASLNTVESYYLGKMRAELAKKYGADITDKQSEYYVLAYQGKAAQKAFLRAHPELRAYWSAKHAYEDQINAQILHTAALLPETAPGAQLRTDFGGAQNAFQQSLVEFSQGQQVPSWQEVSAQMSTPLQSRIIEYAQNGTPLSNAALKELDYLARRGGYYDAQDLLRQAVYSLMQPQQQAQQPAAPQDNSYAQQILNAYANTQ